ncbi:MAG: caspase family protein, partial [Campylobacterota bacterium]|nr:caspase family protein [Campylobacterota bacterium]
ILKLDTKGHTGLIKDIIVTKDGDIISASDDKTIRVWDSKTGKEKRKILGQIGSGSEGKIYAIALSKDESYLAVGGFMAKGGGIDDDKVGNIGIYNYKTGKLLHILKSHTNVVYDLAFNDDGSYLISGSGDTTAKIWRVQDSFKLQDTIKFHTNDVYATKIIKHKNKHFAITAGYDNKIALYDMQTRKIIKSDTLNYKLGFLTTSEKLKHIAVCGFGKEIKIYDFNLNHIKTIQSETKPTELSYDKKARSLLAGTAAYPYNVNIYNTKNNYSLHKSFKKHTNLTMAVAFLERKRDLFAVSGGGNNNEIYIWNTKDTEVQTKIEGVGASVWSVEVKGDELAWRNKSLSLKQLKDYTGELQKSINLKTFKITGISNLFEANSKKPRTSSGFRRISTQNDNYSLQHSKGGDYGYGDAVLNIKKDGTIQAKIIKNSTDGLGNNCYGWYKNYIVSGGSHGQLKIYNKQGKEMASLVGHTGEIWSIALDGDRLVSGSDDQTIKVWDLSFLKNITSSSPEFNEELISKIQKKLDWTRKKVIEKADFLLENKLDIYKKTESIISYPTLSIFISKNNEYIAYTKEGFFNASNGGAKYIGYHINQGADKEARFVSVDKLYDTFYRPDLVQKALDGEDISSYAKNININTILSAGLAPVVSIGISNLFEDNARTSSGFSSAKRDLALNLEVCTIDNGGYDNLTLLLNGTAIDVMGRDRALKRKKSSKTKKSCFTFEKLISLTSGQNIIGFKATNKVGNIESNTAEIEVNYKGRSNKKPNLYILAIGVDKYRDGDLWLNYSKADAKVFSKTIKSVSKPLFKNIYTTTLLDKEVTKKNILKTFEKIGAKTTREDVFMLYVAGHGITDAKTGAYFYLPVDFRYKNENSVRESGLSQNDFKLALSKIQAMKSLTILDTCNSGSFAEAMASRGVLQKTAINKLTRATGRATLVASSKDQV